VKLLKKSASLSLVAAAVLAAGTIVGLAQTTSSAPPTDATSRPAPTPEVARINGKGIPREDFTNALIQIGGLRLLDEYWSFAVTMEACETAGIKIEKKEIGVAKDLILKRVVLEQDKLAKLTEEEKDQVIVQVLARQGVASALQADWMIKTLAGLQALAVRNPEQITPTADDYKTALAIEFSPKAQIRDFVFKTPAEGTTIRGLLTAGKTPDELATQGYQVRPMVLSKGDPNLPAKFKDAIFDGALKEKGFTVPMLQDVPKDAPPNSAMWHVLYIEKFEDAKKEPTGADLEKFKANVADQKVTIWRQNHLNKLKGMSKVEIIDPILRSQAAQIEAMRKQAAEAATRPTTIPAATLPK